MSAPQMIKFFRGAGSARHKRSIPSRFKTSDQTGHTFVGPQNLRWPRAPRSLNPFLLRSNELV